MPYDEGSIRAAMEVLNRFSKISGLTINQGKTQVLKIGGAATMPDLAPDLGLKWVKELTILGINLTAAPALTINNFEDKLGEVNSIFNKWQYRNLTVYGRIKIVKTLALSKLTHVVQIIPQLDEKRIATLHNVHFVKYVFLPTEQAKTYLKSCVLINYSTYICLCLFD